MKFLFRKIIKYIFLPIGILFRLAFKNKNEIMILMYHRVTDEVNKEMAVTKQSFDWQMSYLLRKGYRVISMDQAYNLLTGNNINGKYVVLTFDDGYEDYYINAFPTLKTFNYSSIIYLVPGFIETGNTFWWDEDLGESALLNWRQINELIKSGIVDIGSHSFKHYDLNKLRDEVMQYELETSKEFLEEKTGKIIKHFSYPRGIFTDESENKVKKIYLTGVLMQNGSKAINNLNINYLTRLKRIAIQRSDGRYLFIARLKGWLIIEDFIRFIINKIKSFISDNQ